MPKLSVLQVIGVCVAFASPVFARVSRGQHIHQVVALRHTYVLSLIIRKRAQTPTCCQTIYTPPFKKAGTRPPTPSNIIVQLRFGATHVETTTDGYHVG